MLAVVVVENLAVFGCKGTVCGKIEMLFMSLFICRL